MEVNINSIMDLYGEKILKLTHENVLLNYEKEMLKEQVSELETQIISLKEEKDKLIKGN